LRLQQQHRAFGARFARAGRARPDPAPQRPGPRRGRGPAAGMRPCAPAYSAPTRSPASGDELAPFRRCRPCALSSISTRARACISACSSVGGRGAAAEQRAVARFADAVHGQRVAAQVGEAVVVVQPRGHVQPFEHAGHAGRRIARRGQHAEADTVGLAFHVAREVQLALDGRRLAAHDGGVGGVDVVGPAGRQDAQQQRGHGHHRGVLLRRDAACDVPLRDVRQLVRQHRGQLVGGGRQRDQAQVHAHVAAGQRKGVHAAVAHEERLPGEGAVDLAVDVAELARGRHQRVPQRLQVFLQHGVVQEGRVAPAFAHDLVAQAAFGADAQVGRCRFAQRRQAHLGLHGHGRQAISRASAWRVRRRQGVAGGRVKRLLGWHRAGLEPRRGGVPLWL
jgi:hypothetical protein